ncbi:hypothetical protein PTQ19_15065 [Microbacterium esteraromaticum]|uniref:hypothetical protein n=1 Tax=Microbacterium esteraromaticum TaxID=57043 RepID=UPI002367D5B5|nr:hypothetical protein [Microbacterium esteraromaticum]WDH78808.1 hypothetical protein PTQ19_15065 [Microbacterium esteraromaticum]
MNEAAVASKAWREEVHHLLGLSWDRFVEWMVIAWLAAWLWTAWVVSNAMILPESGPITWFADVIKAFGGEPAAWLVAIPEWLTDPNRAPLLPICVIASAVLSTLSLRSFRLTGLRVLALLSAAIAVEIHGTMLPLVWIALAAAVPFAVSVLLSVLPRDDADMGDEREWSFFYAKGSMYMFGFRVLALYLMPVAAPILLAIALVFSYRIEREYSPSESLGRESARALAAASKKGETVATCDPLVTSSAIVAALTAATPTVTGQRVAASFDHQLRSRNQRPLGAGGIGRSI